MTKKLIDKAFADAEKEQQEKEIKKIKAIVQSYLEKIQEKTEKKNALDEEIKYLKKDLDDLKAGRLDKIKERAEKDDKAKGITLIVVKEKEYIPMSPWKSQWYVEWKPTYYHNDIFYGGGITDYSGAITTVNSSDVDSVVLCSTGSSIANFSTGTYTVNGNTINL